ncbi:MAG: DUF5685 family protein [Oscillospiraceae bacterium]
MFGYVRPNKPELLIREYEEYKAVYCTLCKELGRYYGVISRLALNYDLTFYTMLALDLSGAKPRLRKGRCVVNPTKKCNFICEGEEAYHKGAALTVMMTYHKVRDNVQDEGFWKSLAARMTLPFFNGAFRKAAKDFPFMAEVMSEMMSGQTAVEKEENPSVDACCEPTARALSQIMGELAQEDSGKKLILSQLGYFLGRWIYMMDAADDLGEDMKNQAFNPLVGSLHLSGTEIPEGDRSRVDNACNEILNHNVSMLVSAVNLIDLGRYGSIIENVTHQGLAEVQREILFLHIKEKKHDRPV